jgi:opacity protein-like surface antigen
MERGLVAALLCVSACAAQSYEVGGNIGYGLYRSVRVNAPGAQAEAGIRNRFAAGALIAEDMYDYISGEIRYLYQDGDPFLSAGSLEANIQGQSHTLNYDVLFHFKDVDQKLRPFVAVGAGVKYYRASGPEPRPQPLASVASLVHTDEWCFTADVGFGLKYRIRRRVVVRAEFRDYITRFPKKLFSPAPGGTDRGLFQMFTPMVGVGYLF